MGCQHSKVRDARSRKSSSAFSTTASSEDGAVFRPAIASGACASPTFAFHSPPRRRRSAAVDATPAALPTLATPVQSVVAKEDAPEEVEKAMPQEEASEVAFTAPLFFPVEEEEEVAPILAVTDVAVATEEDKVDKEVLPLPLEEEAIAEQQQQQQEETEMTVPLPVVAEQEEAIAAPVAVMGERTTNATAAPKPRRVAFDKETMRRTAPNTKPIMHNSNATTNSSLTKKQQQMMQSGRKSAGRRGPVASKHSRCKAQMQSDVYLDMANAFERLLTNVNTIDAHLDSR